MVQTDLSATSKSHPRRRANSRSYTELTSRQLMPLPADPALTSADPSEPAFPQVREVHARVPELPTENVGRMTLGKETSTPIGWAKMCSPGDNNPVFQLMSVSAPFAAECHHENFEPNKLVHLDQAAWQTMWDVNLKWNQDMEPLTNMNKYGKEQDVWRRASVDDIGGDCKVYALTKRAELIARGFPPSALSMTVLKLDGGEGHSVLTVHTDKGDFVLDNLKDKIMSWDQSFPTHQYVKIAPTDQEDGAWRNVVHTPDRKQPDADPINAVLSETTPPSSEPGPGGGKTPKHLPKSRHRSGAPDPAASI
jgi:predicted transglutaminase-like cysteine proteinase